MKNTKLCPMCKGDGKITIADYVDRRVVPDLRIKCPVCNGLRFIEIPETNQSKSFGSGKASEFSGLVQPRVKPEESAQFQITFSRENADANPL